MSEKPLRIWFDKTDGFIKIYDGIRCLVLFNHGWYDQIYGRNRYIVREKVVLKITLIIILQESESIHIILYQFFHNAITLIKLVVNMNKNDYYYNIFLEKGSYKEKSSARYFKMNVCVL